MFLNNYPRVFFGYFPMSRYGMRLPVLRDFPGRRLYTYGMSSFSDVARVVSVATKTIRGVAHTGIFRLAGFVDSPSSIGIPSAIIDGD